MPPIYSTAATGHPECVGDDGSQTGQFPICKQTEAPDAALEETVNWMCAELAGSGIDCGSLFENPDLDDFYQPASDLNLNKRARIVINEYWVQWGTSARRELALTR
jgi:hypothetical protein